MKLRFDLPVHTTEGPFGELGDVASDRITITLASREFHRLRPVDELDTISPRAGRVEHIEHSMARIAKSCRARVGAMIQRSGSSGDRST